MQLYPIATAPKNNPEDEAPPLLLFCPEQGGWHVGIYWEGRWVLHFDVGCELEPTHWLPCPPEPEPQAR